MNNPIRGHELSRRLALHKMYFFKGEASLDFQDALMHEADGQAELATQSLESAARNERKAAAWADAIEKLKSGNWIDVIKLAKSETNDANQTR